MSSKKKIKENYEVLPKLNCGFCGFGNCGQFARAVAEGKASPFSCKQNPWSGHRISKILGVQVPAYSYAYQPAFVSRLEGTISPKALGEEVRKLSRRADDILTSIEKLKRENLTANAVSSGGYEGN